jgi:hypothetical protein
LAPAPDLDEPVQLRVLGKVLIPHADAARARGDAQLAQLFENTAKVQETIDRGFGQKSKPTSM